jgi:hypothetical protein
VTGVSLPLDVPTNDGAAVAEASRKRYGRPRAEVEAALRARAETATTPTAGRRRRGGTA